RIHFLPQSTIIADAAATKNAPYAVRINLKQQMDGAKNNPVERAPIYRLLEGQLETAFKKDGNDGLQAELNRIFDSNQGITDGAVSIPRIRRRRNDNESAENNYA